MSATDENHGARAQCVKLAQETKASQTYAGLFVYNISDSHYQCLYDRIPGRQGGDEDRNTEGGRAVTEGGPMNAGRTTRISL